MPVHDYAKLAIRERKKLESNDIISSKNKKLLDRYMLVYSDKVGDARLVIFCKHIKFLLEHFKDVEELLDENLKTKPAKQKARDSVNDFFSQIRKNKSPSYYYTIVSVSNTFIKWHNDDAKPYSFKDIKSSKKGTKRNLVADDMITEEERDLMISEAKTYQMKAMIATQMCGGFRSSEFLDILYGSVSPADTDGFMTIKVTKGKTGPRDVIIYRATPHLQRWLDNHPTKRPKDNLWLTPNKNQKAFTNQAVRKRFQRLMEKLNIKKPFDLYNLRHSACRIAKMNNDPAEWCADKFGHSLDYFNKTYARMDNQDQKDRFKNHLDGFVHEDKKSIICRVCGTANTPDADRCSKCNNPTSLREALKYKKTNEEQEKRLDKMEGLIELMVEGKSDEEIKETFKKFLKSKS